MRMLDSRRAMNAAIGVLLLAVLGVGGYAAFSILQKNRAVLAQTPVSRQIQELIVKVRAKPNDLDLRMQLAQALTVEGHSREAVEQYNNALKLRKDFTPAYAGLGFLAARDKDWETSESYWRKVIELSSKSEQSRMDKTLESAYFYLGSCLIEQKKFEDAAGQFKEALRLNPTASDTHYMLSVCLKEIGSPDLARQELDITLKLDPKMAEANYDMALLMRKAGDQAGAAEHLRASADAAPYSDKPQKELKSFGSVRDRVAKARAALGSAPKQAVIEARIAVALDPRSVDAWIAMGDARAKTGAAKKAVEAYQRALSIDSNSAQAKQGLERVKS